MDKDKVENDDDDDKAVGKSTAASYYSDWKRCRVTGVKGTGNMFEARSITCNFHA